MPIALQNRPLHSSSPLRLKTENLQQKPHCAKMVKRRGRPRNPTDQENINDFKQHESNENVNVQMTTPELSNYEQSREERIKENRERMQKLGILDISLKLKSIDKSTPKRNFQRKTPESFSPLLPSGPVRRSSRLQNSTPVSYSEVTEDKIPKLGNDLLREEEGSKPEIYTKDHERLLGSTELSWTFFVDGYGKDGKRIYDPVRGKTCHQCRQKTLGHRTHCTKCNMVQGQFCGDCLYMRYGEHVLEAIQDSNWTCPVCRGICNCSLCRQAKGWPPTGPLYRKISSLGYKSVAHYLIQTRRATVELEEGQGSKVPVSVKRSLPFSDMETAKDDLGLVESNNNCIEDTQLGDKTSDDTHTKVVEPASSISCSSDQKKMCSKTGAEKNEHETCVVEKNAAQEMMSPVLKKRREN